MQVVESSQQQAQQHDTSKYDGMKILNQNASTLASKEDAELAGLLAKDLNALALNERSRIQEEIHCVRSFAVPETPEMVKNALINLHREADRASRDDGFSSAYQDSLILEASYVQSPEFGLKYLRAELFDISKAAKCMLSHLDLLFKYFGPVALERPLRVSDLTKEEQQALKQGCYQILPSRDRAGRRVMFMQSSVNLPTESERLRVGLYFHSVLSEDVETQKHGNVIIFAGSGYNISYLPSDFDSDTSRMLRCLPLRQAALHYCLPATPVAQIIRAFVLLITRKSQRVRIMFHGPLSSVETQYALMSYGVPIRHFPQTSTGKSKLKNHLQWINMRGEIDGRRELMPAGQNFGDCGVITHPLRADVLFCPGGYPTHIGNMEFQQDLAVRFHAFTTNVDRDKLKDEVVACVKERGGRFLQQQKGGWWSEIDMKRTHQKITSGFYDLKQKMGTREHQQTLSSGTFDFLEGSSKRQKVGDGGCFF